MNPTVLALLCGLAMLTAYYAGMGTAAADQPLPPELRGIAIEERLGQSIALDVPLVEHTGAQVKLADYFQAKRPVILVLNYYSCPTLCSLVLNGMLDGMRGLEFLVGKEYQLVSVSIDPRETPELAKSKRAAYLTALGAERTAKMTDRDWPFLTGSEQNVSAIAKAVGFHYRYDAATNQYAHAAGIFVLTPEGRISRVLYGIQFPARDLRLALVEASQGGIGSPVDRLLLLCYHYDPQTRRYGLTPMGLMRISGVLTVVVLGMYLLSAWRRERRASVSG
jgi:protein SCO1/2